MFRIMLFLALALLFGGQRYTVSAHPSVSVTVAYAQIAMFPTEATAQKHCPTDRVVWLNTRSGIYHYKGERWYGRTKYGAYVCEKEAIAAGYRATENGQ